MAAPGRRSAGPHRGPGASAAGGGGGGGGGGGAAVAAAGATGGGGGGGDYASTVATCRRGRPAGRAVRYAAAGPRGGCSKRKRRLAGRSSSWPTCSGRLGYHRPCSMEAVVAVAAEIVDLKRHSLRAGIHLPAQKWPPKAVWVPIGPGVATGSHLGRPPEPGRRRPGGDYATGAPSPSSSRTSVSAVVADRPPAGARGPPVAWAPGAGRRRRLRH